MRRYAEPLDPTPGTERPRFTPPHQRCLTVCFAQTVATLSPLAAGPLIPAPTRRAAGSRPSWQDPDRVQYQCLELPEAPAVKRLGREREILRGLLDQSCSNLLVTHQSVLPRSRRVGPKKSMNRPSHTPIMSLRPRIGACRVTQACGESQAYCPVASSCGGAESESTMTAVATAAHATMSVTVAPVWESTTESRPVSSRPTRAISRSTGRTPGSGGRRHPRR